MKYVPLYIKTHNSLLSSMIKIEDLIIKAKEYNIDTLTITDDNMYGCMDFYMQCTKNGIKPIIGLSLKINNYTFVLYAKNVNGYKCLLKLSTINSEREIKIDDLKQYNSDLICIVPIESGKIYNSLKQIYNDIFIGYKNISERQKYSFNNMIYFNKTLYLDKNDKTYLKYLYGIRDGIILENINDDDSDHYLLSYDEFVKNYPMDIKNNIYIYESCNLEIKENENLIPIYNCPDGLDSYSYLKKLCMNGMLDKFNDSPKEYLERLNYELNVIKDMGFCNYFLIVWDYVKFAKENGILVGPGRGSAAASLVSYLLNITTVDPIKYHLIFERFLNPMRVTMPDIDIDFEYTKREEIVNYCIKKYGIKHVAPIITFGTMAAKQAIRDVGRVMDIDLDMVNSICKQIDVQKDLIVNYKENEKLRQLINLSSDTKTLFKVAAKLEGIKRHTSIHAAGIVMSSKELDEIVPLDKSHTDYYITGYSMTYLETLGLLKMDFLALRNLTIINDCLNDINNGLNFDTIIEDDVDALKVFYDVNTVGIFQFESSGMVNFLRKFKIHNFEDIVVSLALFRPGPMNNIDLYIKRRNGLEKIDYFHKDLEEILKPTYGIIVYQEQIMQIVSKMAGYSYGEADILRRAISKKKEDVLIKEREKFVSGSIKNGYDENLSNKIYDLIVKFASYGFNRAHSVSYAFISYRMAYLKAHYPLYFMKQLLNGSIGSETKTKDYIYECKKNNIKVILPSINKSYDVHIVRDNAIIFSLSSIKNIGTNIAKQIVLEREKGLFKDIFDFALRVYGKSINKKHIEALIDAGCMDEFGYNRKTLKENLDLIINYSEIGSLLDDDELRPEIVFYNEYTKIELMKNELNVYGFYLSNNPITEVKLKYPNIVNLNEINLYFDKFVNIAVYVDSIREIKTKNGDKMSFIEASDEIDKIELVLFPKFYRDNVSIKEGEIILVNGKVEKRFDKYQIVVSKVKEINI